jgi:hypothetical protein
MEGTFFSPEKIYQSQWESWFAVVKIGMGPPGEGAGNLAGTVQFREEGVSKGLCCLSEAQGYAKFDCPRD